MVVGGGGGGKEESPKKRMRPNVKTEAREEQEEPGDGAKQHDDEEEECCPDIIVSLKALNLCGVDMDLVFPSHEMMMMMQTALTQLMWQLLMEHGQRHSDIVMYDLDKKSLQPMCSKLPSDFCMVFAGHVSICKGSKSYKICSYKGVFLSTDVRSTH